jgi:ABC transporter
VSAAWPGWGSSSTCCDPPRAAPAGPHGDDRLRGPGGGRSGSGKTTLLNIIGGLDAPTAGRVRVDGREVTKMTERDRLTLRRNRIAFVFQAFGLVPMLSAAENVGIPLRIEGLRASERRERVAAMLALTGISSHVAHRPGELSGGRVGALGAWARGVLFVRRARSPPTRSGSGPRCGRPGRGSASAWKARGGRKRSSSRRWPAARSSGRSSSRRWTGSVPRRRWTGRAGFSSRAR